METLFAAVLRRPRATLALASLFALAWGAAIPWMRFDNRPDAFIPQGHPALIAKERVESLFDLRDPMMLALTTPVRDGVFQTQPLERLQGMTTDVLSGLERLEAAGTIPWPGPHPVYSLATEHSVESVGGIPQEFPFLEPFPRNAEDLERLKKSVFDLELYTGVIVAEDGSAAAVVVMPPPGHSAPVYELLVQVTDLWRGRLAPGEALHLAGEAAVRSAMGDAVARDGLRFNPVCVVVIMLFLYAAFRSLMGVLVPLSVVGCSLLVMLGLMASTDTPFYIITSAIPVTVMSIGVASSMHLLAEFYEGLRRSPAGTPQRDVVLAMCRRLWLPLLFTAMTDVAGFASTYVSGIMPPLEWFGLFSAVGLGVSLIFAWTVVPAALVLVDASKARHQRMRGWAVEGVAAGAVRRLGLMSYDHPWMVLTAGAVVVALGAAGTLRLRANQSMESTFREDSAIVQASRALNRLFHGTYFLDVLVEGEQPGDMTRPDVLGRIDELESYAKTLPHVGGTLSVAGFAKKMHQILSGGSPEERRLLDSAAAVREELDLIRRSSPTKLADLRRVVTDDYRVANVRIRVRSGESIDEERLVEVLEPYVARQFAGLGVRASLAGRVYMDHHWMRLVVRSNAANVALALGLVFFCMVLMFRSLTGGLFCLVPVLVAVLATYAVMGWAGIDLGIGTSMFAAIATGVGVDYPTHVLSRLRVLVSEEGREPRAAFADAMGIAGKAVLFNAAAVAFGFLVLVVSELPLLVHFGVMIAVGILTACAVSLTVLPALVRCVRPAFIFRPRRG